MCLCTIALRNTLKACPDTLFAKKSVYYLEKAQFSDPFEHYNYSECDRCWRIVFWKQELVKKAELSQWFLQLSVTIFMFIHVSVAYFVRRLTRSDSDWCLWKLSFFIVCKQELHKKHRWKDKTKLVMFSSFLKKWWKNTQKFFLFFLTLASRSYSNHS